MKIILFFIISMQVFAQTNWVSVTPKDMLVAKCKPQLSLEHLVTKKDYVKELMKYGVRGGGLINQRDFKIEHLKDVLIAVNYFPKWMRIGDNTDWDHIRLMYVPNKDLVANAVIQLGKKWLEHSSLYRQAIIIHELSHRLSNRFGGYAYTKHWQELEDNWIRNSISRRGYASKDNPNAEFVSIYARTNPSEDWAESLTSYRINPDLLKKVSPVKYDFFKKHVYLGVEYETEQSCKDADLIDLDFKLDQRLAAFLDDNFSAIKQSIKEVNNISLFKKKKRKPVSLKRSIQNILMEKEKDNSGPYTDRDFKFKIYIESDLSNETIENSQIFDKYKRIVQ